MISEWVSPNYFTIKIISDRSLPFILPHVFKNQFATFYKITGEIFIQIAFNVYVNSERTEILTLTF